MVLKPTSKTLFFYYFRVYALSLRTLWAFTGGNNMSKFKDTTGSFPNLAFNVK